MGRVDPEELSHLMSWEMGQSLCEVSFCCGGEGCLGDLGQEVKRMHQPVGHSLVSGSLASCSTTGVGGGRHTT